MDQIKIGKFIASKRKEQDLTQAQLAEMLGITDRAISKWETGKSLPDASIMLDLCSLLKITVNDLLSGEVVSMDNYNNEMEKNLLKMVEQKEQSDKRLLRLEILIGIISTVLLLLMIVFGAVLIKMDYAKWIVLLLFGIGMVQFAVCMLLALRIEQVAGYYQCKECGHKYVPTYKNVNLAMHVGRTRYMKCPECNKWSWQKKVLNKE
ncbi:MAG: helix-turn-helix domain-containing protein [Ruminococcus sp.]|nr:helix-turn-helix domain-containing protein [Ruminococcus sp.]